MRIDWANRKAAIVTLIVVGLLVYFVSFFNGFVIDDLETVVGSPLIHSINNLPKFFKGGAFPRGSSVALQGQYYRPLMLTFFSALYTIFGANASFFHFFQVVLFIFNAILVYLLLKEFLKPSVSLVLSLIFLVHPMNLLPAIFVSSAGDTLFMAFGLLAILLVKKSLKLGIGKLIVLGFLLLSSVLSKEAGVLFFVLSVVTAFFYQKKNLWKVLITGLITSGLYIYLRVVLAKTALVSSNFAPIGKASLYEKVLTTPKVLSYYLTSLVVPLNLSMFQHWIVKPPSFMSLVFPLMIIIFFFGILIFVTKLMIKKGISKNFIFFLIWFFLGIALLLPFFPLDMTVSDRWFYFPMIGLLGLLGALWEGFNLKATNIIKAIIIIAIILLSVRSIVRILNWKSNFTLASSDIKYNSDSFETQNLYGLETALNGNLKDGEIHLKKSVEIMPYGVNLTNLGSIYLAEGKLDLALTTFEQAGKFHYYKAYEDIAGILLFHGDTKEAIKEISYFLKFYPTDPKLWQILALAELKIGDKKMALTAANRYSQLIGTGQSGNLYDLISTGATFDQITNPKNTN